MEKSDSFFNLTPERVLNAVELLGVRCTGRCLQLNSMENRVFEIEIELPEDMVVAAASERFRIAKFYRPGRWSKQQILEEHRFLRELKENDVPVVAPLHFPSGETLLQLPEAEIFFTVFPKAQGRAPDELNDDQVAQMGRLLARLHNIGEKYHGSHKISRIELSTDTYGRQCLAYLLDAAKIPKELASRFEQIVASICEQADKLFTGIAKQRLHGDCHRGNVLWGSAGPFLVDFDDMVIGPCVQDLWLLVPGRDEEGKKQLEKLVSAYESMRHFDHRQLALIEPLRALRYIMFAAWIGRRWSDPAFQRSFPYFGTERYWQELLSDLHEQSELIQNPSF